jgi:hypothetical protein
MKRAFARALAVTVIAAGIGVGTHHPARACYRTQPALSEAFTSSDTVAVVIGRVAGDVAVVGPFSTLTIELSDVYGSGNLVSPVRVHTVLGGSPACGFDGVPAGPTGFVLGSLESGELWPEWCEGLWAPEAVRSIADGLGVERSGPVDEDGHILAAPVGTPESSSVADNVDLFQARWWIVPFVLIAVGVFLRRRRRDRTSTEPGHPADDGTDG